MDLVAIIVGSVALVVAVFATVQVVGLHRRVSSVPADGDVFRALRELDADLGGAEAAIADMGPRLAGVEARIPHAVTHTGVVAYDAFDNIAGNQSRSIALLSDAADGIVISVLVGRNETLFFTKEVRRGEGSEPLSPEEQRAIRQALGR